MSPRQRHLTESRSTGSRKRLDLLFTRSGKPPVILELELHTKAKAQDCVEIFRGYREAHTIGHSAGVTVLLSFDASLLATWLNAVLDRAHKASHLPA